MVWIELVECRRTFKWGWALASAGDRKRGRRFGSGRKSVGSRRSSPQERREAVIWTLTSVSFILVLIAFAFLIYPAISGNRESKLILDNLPYLIEGAGISIGISVFSIFFALGLGILLGVCRVSKNWILYRISTGYVEIIRGTPLLVQVLIWYFVVPPILGIPLPDPIIAGILALGVHSAAYQAEIIRGAIQSLPKGQFEAAKSLGMRNRQVFTHVILPQALRNAIPPLSNEFIIVIKDSSLVSVIGIAELLRRTQYIISRTYAAIPMYLGCALIYFLMTFTLSNILRAIERRAKIPGLGVEE